MSDQEKCPLFPSIPKAYCSHCQGTARGTADQRSRSSAGTGITEYKYEDVTQLVAAVIDKHSNRSRKYLPHSNLKKGLLLDPHARSIIDRIPATSKFRTPEAWAGVIIAGFSKE